MTQLIDRKALASRTSLLLTLWIVISLAFILRVSLIRPSNEYLAAELMVVLIAAIVSVARCSNAGFWSPASMFLAVLGVFHAGLAPFLLFGIDPVFPRASDYVWFHGPEGAMAFQLVTSGVVSYTVAVLLAMRLRRARPIVELRDPAREDYARRFSRVGSLLLVVSLGAWFAVSIRSAGFGILTGSYSEFLAQTSGTSLDVVYLAIGFGLGMTVIARLDGFARFAVVFFLVFAVLGFLLGLRGEVLFPVAVAATIMAFRRRIANGFLVAVGLVVVLTLVNIAKQVRQLGVAESAFDWTQASPLAALGELGSTLRVVATVAGWHEGEGEPFRGGATYTVALVRALESLTAGSGRISASSDFRLFNSEIATRAGAIGGSLIGEAYHNFAAPGVVIILALIGLALGAFSNSAPTAAQLAAYAAIAVPLFNHVRNSFVPVLPAIALSLTLVVLVRAFKPGHIKERPRR